MKRQLLLLAALIFGGASAWADDASTIEISKPAAVSETNMPTPDNGEETEAVASTLSEEALAAAGEYRSFESVAPGATRLGGPITTYTQKDNLFWEITPSQLGVDYIMVISIARGIGESELYGGQSWNFGNDMIWRFRKVGDRIQFLRRNYRYRANKGPDSEALKVAYADSVVFSLPIVASGPQGGDVIDVTGLFMSDTLANVSSRALTGFSFDRSRSRWESIKGLKDNVEIEVEATYGGRAGSSDTVIDTRGVSINVHYSISRLKDEGYKPRYADERVGYFNSAVCDVSDLSTDGNFKRYIDRWHIEKLEPEAEKSLPKKPLVFWLDKATPYQYRKLLRDGILEWNRAFEQAGFYNAVEVRQQEDNDDWDPEDINYNTIRWSVSQTGFAIGPRRVNPMTGQILDADVVLTVGFLTSWTRQFDLYSPQQLADKFSGLSASEAFQKAMADGSYDSRKSFAEEDTELFYSQQFGLANTFFDVMAIADETAVEDAAAQVEAAQAAEEEAKNAAEEAAAKAAELAAKAQEEAKKVAEEAAAKAAEAAAKAQEEAKKLAEELAKADEAVKAELTAKVDEAKAKAEEALRVANEAAAKADEVKKAWEAEKKAEEEAKKAAEAAKAEQAKKAEEAKKAAEAAAKAEATKKENKAKRDAERKKMIEQGLKSLITHEVGHTLGLRHNFKQSALYSLEEINSKSWDDRGFVGSIMEYAPINIMPKGKKQGDYFSYRLADYDFWVIEYGYRVFPGKTTETEVPELKKLAAMQTKPELNYATDEDAYGTTCDPYVNVWDLSSDPIEYAKTRCELVSQLMPGLTDRIVQDGESYNRLRARFNMLTSWKNNGLGFAARFIGGVSINRDFKGDANARAPFVVTPAAKQREAMALLCKEAFGVDSYQIPDNMFNYLAPNRWNHWGSSIPDRYDTDVHGTILAWQNSLLNTILSSTTLSHLADGELRVAAGEDVFTSAEMIDSLGAAIFQEIADSAKATKDRKEGQELPKLTVSSTRRNLQRVYLSRLADFATSTTTAAGSADFGALARMQMRAVRADIETILNGDVPAGAYERAHLENLRERIDQALEAKRVL